MVLSDFIGPELDQSYCSITFFSWGEVEHYKTLTENIPLLVSILVLNLLFLNFFLEANVNQNGSKRFHCMEVDQSYCSIVFFSWGEVEPYKTLTETIPVLVSVLVLNLLFLNFFLEANVNQSGSKRFHWHGGRPIILQYCRFQLG
jgi:hypothetical protein